MNRRDGIAYHGRRRGQEFQSSRENRLQAESRKTFSVERWVSSERRAAEELSLLVVVSRSSNVDREKIEPDQAVPGNPRPFIPHLAPALCPSCPLTFPEQHAPIGRNEGSIHRSFRLSRSVRWNNGPPKREFDATVAALHNTVSN